MSALVELTSPFIHDADDETDLGALLRQQRPSLFRELLTSPNAIAARMLDPAQASTAMAQTLGLMVLATSVTGAFVASLVHTDALRGAGLLPISVVLAVAAAMGPVAGTAVMAGARMPWQLLAAALTSAVTAGALTLVALMPVGVVAMRIDAEWAGPIAIVAAFVIAGAVSGRKIRSMFNALAAEVCDRTGAALPAEALARIDLVGRVALVQLAFTTSLALWSLEVIK